MLDVTLDCIVGGIQRYGGISNYWSRLIRHCSYNEEINFNLIVPARLSSPQLIDEVSLVACESLVREKIPPLISRYCDVVRDNRSGIFHSSYYRVPDDRNSLAVVTVYDFIYERFVNGVSRLVHSFQKRRSILRADLILCISESTREDMLNMVPNVDESRVRVVPLGIDLREFYPTLGFDLASQHRCNEILYVGQRRGYKRFDLAVKSLAQCHDFVLSIVGPELSSNEIADLNRYLGKRWIYYGAVSMDKLRDLYSKSAAFIFPSDYEGFGLPILEAMACGLTCFDFSHHGHLETGFG